MITLRRILEKLARGKRLRRHIYVKGQRVPIIVSPDAQLKYLKSGAEAFDFDLIRITEIFLITIRLFGMSVRTWAYSPMQLPQLREMEWSCRLRPIFGLLTCWGGRGVCPNMRTSIFGFCLLLYLVTMEWRFFK